MEEIMLDIDKIHYRTGAVVGEFARIDLSGSVFVIEKIWTDSLENEHASAVGYTAIGYVESEERARSIVLAGRMLTSKDCWAISDMIYPAGMNEYRYKKLELINEKINSL